MKHFINDRTSIVTDALSATIELSDGKLTRLDGFPEIKVILCADAARTKDTHVALISGGGSGHEPAHAGFVGDGMLTAAVCGEIFASPSVDAVLAAILAVTGAAGCLLIVKSYTGDRLNFGLAAEKARALGLAVEMVVVADDIALPEALQPRGIAGTLFVHKIAGHYAREGGSLAEVAAIAQRAASGAMSLGLALTSVSVPGQSREERIGSAEVELGLGIHGEPGAKLVPLAPARELVSMMTAALARRGGVTRSALLVNDLGGVPPIEMAIVTKELLEALAGEVALVIGPARMMTALDMKGFSISLLALDDVFETALASEVAPHAWPPARRPLQMRPAPEPLPSALKARPDVASPHPERRRSTEAVCRALIAAEAELNALDAKIGDGDTGSTFATAARAILNDLDRLPFADAPALCATISNRLAKGMGGSSGVLLAIFFAAAGVCAETLAGALRSGVSATQKYGGAKAGDRTMLDAFLPAIEALEAGASLDHAARVARIGADRTMTMPARAGRASYVRAEVLAGVPDPGAVAIACAFEALRASVQATAGG